MKWKDTKCSYRHPTQTTTADRVLVMATPKVLIMGSMPVTESDITSDLRDLSYIEFSMLVRGKVVPEDLRNGSHRLRAAIMQNVDAVRSDWTKRHINLYEISNRRTE
jgi:hypothetical protein